MPPQSKWYSITNLSIQFNRVPKHTVSH